MQVLIVAYDPGRLERSGAVTLAGTSGGRFGCKFKYRSTVLSQSGSAYPSLWFPRAHHE